MLRRRNTAAAAAIALAVAGVAGSAAAQDGPSAAQLRDAAAALQRGQLDQAIQAYTDALTDRGLSNDRRAVVHVDRGVAYMRRQLHRQAIEDFNRAVALFPEYAPTYNNRGNALLALGAAREAIKDFDRAIVLSPSYSAAFANRAAAQARLAAPDRALADYTRAIELSPQSVSALNGRGLVHLAAERPHAAARDFTRAVDLDPRFVAGYRNRALAHAALDKPEEAIEDLSRAITFDSRALDNYLSRAEAYLATNNPASALKDFNKVIELVPNHAGAFAGRAFALARAEAFDDAVTDLTKAMELDPKLSRAYAIRAWVYKQMQQLDLAQKDVERATKLEPVTADAHWALGELEEARARTDAAVQAYTRALGVNARHRPTLDALNRLGLVATREETEVAGAGADGWRVMQSGEAFVAISSAMPKVRVPLEMLGKGTPKILRWERQKQPHTGFGVLTFAAGQIEGAPGAAPEPLESAAIVDITAESVLGMPLAVKGTRKAAWSWDDGRLVVTSAEGLTEEFALKGVKPTPAVAAVDGRVPGRVGGSQTGPGGVPKSSGGGVPAWAPWAQPSPSYQPPPRQASRQQKPKTLFEMLFGN